MTFELLLAAAVERTLNHILYRDRALKAVRQQLKGKVLAVNLQELPWPLILAFSDNRVDVLSKYREAADCTVCTRISAQHIWRDRQNLASMLSEEKLVVTGDIQVVQHLSVLFDMAEFDPTEYLTPWTGDIAAQSIGQIGRKIFRCFSVRLLRNKEVVAQILTEEWRCAPGRNELACFTEEVDVIQRSVETFKHRLTKMEAECR